MLRHEFDKTFLVLDFETERANTIGEYNKIWEVGLLSTKLNGPQTDLSFYIKWSDLNISKEAAIITGYNEDRVKEHGLTPVEGFGRLQKALQNHDYVIGQNIFNFDWMVYMGFCRMMGEKRVDLEKKVLDTLCLGKAIQNEIPFRQDMNIFDFQCSMVSLRSRNQGLSLGAMAKKYDVDYDSSKHHKEAFYDCKVTWDIFKKQIWKLEI